MLAIHAKRGVESTLERVFNNAGNRFGSLEFIWSGSTAGIVFERSKRSVNAKIMFPAINETSEISRAKFNNLIGYALHELGHAWFTDNEPWDEARSQYGGFVANLINGLEDPRIELKVIQSGHASNSRVLFEDLANSILAKDGYVDANDLKNVPFLLAIEGRRLNGYQINVPNVIDDAPWAEHLHWALGQARYATNTQQIVDVAIELYKRLKQDQERGGEGGDKPEPEDDEGEEGEGGEGNKPTDKPDGQEGDEGGDEGGKGEGGKPTDKPSDKPNDKPARGKGQFEGGRNPEPSEFIEDELSGDVQSGGDVPNIIKPRFETFTWG